MLAFPDDISAQGLDAQTFGEFVECHYLHSLEQSCHGVHRTRYRHMRRMTGPLVEDIHAAGVSRHDDFALCVLRCDKDTSDTG